MVQKVYLERLLWSTALEQEQSYPNVFVSSIRAALGHKFIPTPPVSAKKNILSIDDAAYVNPHLINIPS